MCLDIVDACSKAGRGYTKIEIGVGRNQKPTRLPLSCYMVREN